MHRWGYWPSEFWSMSPQEFWRGVKFRQPVGMVGHLTKDTFQELKALLNQPVKKRV